METFDNKEMFKWLEAQEARIEYKWRTMVEWPEIWDAKDQSTDLAAKLFFCQLERVYSFYICPITYHFGLPVVAVGHPYMRDAWYSESKNEAVKKAQLLWENFLLLPIGERKELY